MNMVLMAKNSIAIGLRALGDAILTVYVAERVDHDPNPGEDYVTSHVIHTGKGAWDKIDSSDYPGTVIMMEDKTLLLMECDHKAVENEFVKVGNQTHRVVKTNDSMIGDTCILQKLLCRPEPKDIAWESSDPAAAT